MSGLGGSILGSLGFGWLAGAGNLGQSGLEGKPDGGGAGGGVDDLLINDAGDHLLINDSDSSVLKIND